MNSVILVEDVALSLNLDPNDVEYVFNSSYNIFQGAYKTSYETKEMYRTHLRAAFPTRVSQQTKELLEQRAPSVYEWISFKILNSMMYPRKDQKQR